MDTYAQRDINTQGGITTQRVIIVLIIAVILYLIYESFGSGRSRKTSPLIVKGGSKPTSKRPEVEIDTQSTDSDLSVRPTMNNIDKKRDLRVEGFRANGIGNPVIDQGTWDNAYTLMNPPLSAGGDDTMSDRLIVHQVSNKEAIALVTEIKAYIANTIISHAKTCQQMHGDEVQLHDGKRGLTLACVTDPYDLRDKIIDGIYEMIYVFLKSRFGINMNPYVVYFDLHKHLNLMEGIIMPLRFSGLFTVHGVQYTNEDWIRNKVQDNLNVRHVLFTVFSRRNIEFEVDTDQHVH